MSDGMEKLVEEIAEAIQLKADIGLQDFEAESTFAWEYERDRRARTLAEDLIARTLKAIVDGLPLPGEEARVTSDVEGPFIYLCQKGRRNERTDGEVGRGDSK